MEESTIVKTKDYSVFKSVTFNRDVDLRHVERLKKLMTKENLLNLHPIIVNNQMEVIDGQHRLQAARELNQAVFYIQADVTYKHILYSNYGQKKLDLRDILKFYAEKDRNPNYIKLLSIMSELGLGARSLLCLLTGMFGGSLTNAIKEGAYIFPTKQQEKIDYIKSAYVRFVDFMKENKFEYYPSLKGTAFCTGFRTFILLDEFDMTSFFNNVKKYWQEMEPQPNSKFWLRFLIKFYNKRNPNPLASHEKS